MSVHGGLTRDHRRRLPARASGTTAPSAAEASPSASVGSPAPFAREFVTIPIREHGRRAESGPLIVGPIDDAAEREAHRIADAIGDGPGCHGAAAIGVDTRSQPLLQRQVAGSPTVQTPAPGSAAWQAAVAKAALDKEGAQQREKMMAAALEAASQQEPLKSMIAKGKAFASTPGGVLAITEVVTTLITAFVLAKQELPLTTFTFDLGTLSGDLQGIKITPTWKGPANDPTEAGVKVEMAPKGSPLSITQGFSTGSGSPSTVTAGVGIRPGGGVSLTGDLKVGDGPLGRRNPLDPRIAGARVEGSVGATWQPARGTLSGVQFSGKGSFDDVGNKAVTFSVTIPLGSVPRKAVGDERLQRAATPGVTAAPRRAPPSVEGVLGQSGAPLPAGVRADMGRWLGADFSGVRVHADPVAAASARELDAIAYTVRNHVVLASGHVDTSSVPGRRLLAHELVHVVQQGGAAVHR